MKRLNDITPEARISLLATGVTLLVGLVLPLFAH